MTNFNQIKTVKDLLLFIGLLYTSKLTLKTILKLYQGFRTFILPHFWHRDFRKEYGSWAGIFFIIEVILFHQGVFTYF